MTNPTPLSPAAQAVLNAFGKSLTAEQYTTSGRIEIAVAAALRAAAAQFFFDWNGMCCEEHLKAIAAELEAQ